MTRANMIFQTPINQIKRIIIGTPRNKKAMKSTKETMITNTAITKSKMVTNIAKVALKKAKLLKIRKEKITVMTKKSTVEN